MPRHIKYTKELLEPIVARNLSVMGVMRELGLAPVGGNHSHMTRRIKAYELDTSHFTGQNWNKGQVGQYVVRTTESILVLLPEGSRRTEAKFLRRAMMDSGVELKCSCGLTDEWQGLPIVLEIDHLDGNYLNNLLENLRFLCPNCHSQQATGKPWKNSK